ncbi:aldose epimerase family protein [Shewanella ulleungensis]|uniref:Aldose 1-epimerase n=1 Tax=Shewanella ulleungensis TaxID=2282699 RepID=A0ABQ2QMM1_9GAMM|nr:aldose epimerase family protein [Shewanella ulleungensis]MCL1150288.1 galactose mutarotase [Shewanella ulleungensis]GGP88535.1 aldose 1-epimerase [Shewanella ulleungensis]
MVRFSVLEPWQDPRGGEIERVRIDNGIIALEVLSLGGIIRSLWTPDRNGERKNIVLGCDSAEDYLTQQAHLGAVAGRYSNRIANGAMEYQGQRYSLSVNQATNCLHGGTEGFNRKLWQLGTLSDGVRLTLKSPDGDMGFPGNCTVQLDYRLVGNNLYVEMLASTDKACPISLTQHSYFNLDGNRSDTNTEHTLQVDAKTYLTMNDVGIPTAIQPTTGSDLDMAVATLMSVQTQRAALAATKGFDHCYILDNPGADLQRFGCLASHNSGRRMTVYTNQPGVQVYGANFLQGTVAKKQRILADHQAVCIEPQMLPDSPNQPHLPGASNVWVTPESVYHHITRYQFDAK